ncbi:hypothetical protein B6D60_08050, partial [candidate division KSB1 bacterium 4484_87]
MKNQFCQSPTFPLKICNSFKKTLVLALLILLSVVLVSRNSESQQEDLAGPFPYQLEKKRIVAKETRFFDLNNDGIKEVIDVKNDVIPKTGLSNIHIYSSDFVIVDQLNPPGPVRRVFHIDWTGDGKQEFFYVYTVNDSSFLGIYSYPRKPIANGIFLFAGKSGYRRSGKKIEWQGNINYLYCKDLDGDGKKELIAFPDEPYMLHPRGVFVYDGKTFERKWKFETGAGIARKPIFIDSDGDGRLEILIPTKAPSNGSKAGKFNDSHSYLFSIDYDGKLRWVRKFGDAFSSIRLDFVDVDGIRELRWVRKFGDASSPVRHDFVNANGDGEQEIFAFLSYWDNSKKNPSIHVIDPKTGKTLRSREFDMIQATHLFIRPKNNERKRLIICDTGNPLKSQMLLLDEQFNDIYSTTFSKQIAG